MDWAKLQPRPSRPPDFSQPNDGCSRGTPPCLESDGLRDLLRAIEARRRVSGGWQVVLVIYGTPAWAASSPRGCERSGTRPRSRMPDLDAYRAFVRSVQALGRREGVRLAYWSPWNEPNHPAFLNPQRSACDPRAPAISPSLYARLARVTREELGPGQRLLVGELAGYDEPRATATAAGEFVRGLPRDVACAPGPWAQHTYVGRRASSGSDALAADTARAGNGALVDTVAAGLAARGCPKPIWITETGAFDHGCAAMASALAEWARDPRVDAAFQYTFREDAAFPVGLADAALKRLHPSYRAWRAYAGGVTRAPPQPCA